jgi:hypothetical protein
MRNENTISIVLNDNQFDYTNEIDAIRQGFLILTKKMPYQSAETIKINISHMCKLFKEALTNSKELSNDELRIKLYTSLLRKLTLFNSAVSKNPYLDGKKGVELIYNFSLGLDGLSLLHGFGFSNRMKDKLTGNSEKESLSPRKFQESKTQRIA